MDQRERAQQMNRDGKGQFAATVFPIGESDSLAALKAAQIAMRGLSQGLRVTFSDEDLAQMILLAVFKNEKLMSKPPEERAKVMHRIAIHKLTDHIRGERGRKGQKPQGFSLSNIDWDEDHMDVLGVTDHYASDDNAVVDEWQVSSVMNTIDGNEMSDDESLKAAEKQLDEQLASFFDGGEIGEGKAIPLKPPISVAALKKHLVSWKRLQAAYDLPEIQAVASSDYVLLTQAVKRLSNDDHPSFQKGVQSLLRQWPQVDYRTKQLFTRHFPSKDVADRVVEIMRGNPAVASSIVTTFSVVGRWKGLSEPGSLFIDDTDRYTEKKQEGE
jgi:DNA-directed RNA polymerase specialized sigma24 family protein